MSQNRLPGNPRVSSTASPWLFSRMLDKVSNTSVQSLAAMKHSHGWRLRPRESRLASLAKKRTGFGEHYTPTFSPNVDFCHMWICAQASGLVLTSEGQKACSAMKRCGSSLRTPPLPNCSRFRSLSSGWRPTKNLMKPSQRQRQHASNVVTHAAPSRHTGSLIAARSGLPRAGKGYGQLGRR
jgi:hypothetical protein